LPLAALATLTAPGALTVPAPDGRLRCLACAHRCALGPGQTGRCGVRFRDGDEIRAPFGYVAARRVLAVERNTLYHVRPGTRSLTFGMYGCDLRCPYCSNWTLSQALRDGLPLAPQTIAARELVDEARAAGCRVMCSAFNEPMITAEWARAVFAEAKRVGLITAMISDGNTTEEALRYMRPVTDVYRVDLKGFDAAQLDAVGAVPGASLAAIRVAKRLGYWVEVVTLVVPGFNDAPAGLRSLAGTLADIDPSMPWHLNGFVPRYRCAARPPASLGVLVVAAGMGYARGLRYVYVGNVASGAFQHTRCPGCHGTLVSRRNYAVASLRLARDRCPDCDARVPGLWC
jgi:pyruvate formate lyase activating enzyme